MYKLNCFCFIGQITEDQFTARVLQMQYDSLDSVLAFSIVPEDINAEAHRAFTNSTRQPPTARVRNYQVMLLFSVSVLTDLFVNIGNNIIKFMFDCFNCCG